MTNVRISRTRGRMLRGLSALSGVVALIGLPLAPLVGSTGDILLAGGIFAMAAVLGSLALLGWFVSRLDGSTQEVSA